MKRRFLAALGLAAGLAQAQSIPVPPAMVLDGVPPLPAAIAQAVAPYSEFRTTAVQGWHPERRELLVRQRLAETNQLHLVTEPGRAATPLTDLPDAVAGGSWHPRHGRFALLWRGVGGDEAFRLFRLDADAKAPVAISAPDTRASAPAWSPKGDRVAWLTVPLDRTGPIERLETTLWLAPGDDPAKSRVAARLPGGSWTGLRFSPDGRRVALVQHRSAGEGAIWIVTLATGKARRATPEPKGEPVHYADPQFAPDGRGLYAISDRGADHRHVAFVDLASGRETALATNLRFDVEDLAISAKAGRLAFVTNEAGSHVLRFIDLATRKEVPRPALVDGVISSLHWRPDGGEIAFTHASARSPGDAFSYDVNAHRVTRWTNGNGPRVNTSEFVEPRVIRWKSFDGREITGLYYHPPSRFEGVRPVLVNVHGGPAAQARAGWIGRHNYLVNELGVALVYPNVRGSAGFGKAFLRLDDGRLREDPVKDLGALLDWIGAQPGLDASRVMVAGGSYGGYMALAASVHYAERIAAAASTVGISNFVTFLERTETYRRDNRRAEYGDERDPAMREFLQSISPLTHASRIAKPMLVAQGRRDPRVPWTESEQIVAALKAKGTPAWYLLAADEGHGFQKKANADFHFHALVAFIRQHLLAP